VARGRLRPLDLAILLVLVPIFALGFTLHTVNWVRGHLAEPSVYVEAPARADDFPVVRSLRIGGAADASGIRPGDRLLRIGDADLRGAGPMAFFARALRAVGPDGWAAVAYMRDGSVQETSLQYTKRPLPVRYVLVALSFALVAVVIVLRAPAVPAAQAAFRGFLTFSFGFLRPWGGPEWQTYAWVALVTIVGAFTPLLVLAVDALGDGAVRTRPALRWPWVFIPVGPVFVAGIVGVPLFGHGYNHADPISMLLLALLGVAILAVLARSFRRSDPVGRRKIKWIVFALYLSLVPVIIATAISMSDLRLWWLSDVSEIFEVLIPVGVLIAIVRFNLFDIDRLISATAAYSVLIGLVLVGALTVVPAVAQAASDAVGIERWSGQLILSTALVSVALSARHGLRDRIDHLFFPERWALAEDTHQLLRELSRATTPRELLVRAGERLDALLRPEACVLYARMAEGYAPVHARGRAVPPQFDEGHPVIDALTLRGVPLAAEGWGTGRGRRRLHPFDGAALASLDAAVLLPVMGGDDLLAFVSLGPKRSGDVYTATDLALLASVTEKLSVELARFSDAEIIRQSHEMQAALRRYVPGAVAEELASGRDLRAGECEVSVLFVDIRGYTSYSQGRQAEEIFGTVNRYTEIVSEIIRRHAGSVVEFNGDGMLAVFGAPQGLATKERASVTAGREILAAMTTLPTGSTPGAPPLSVGIGIATGDAYVGNIRAVDRLIWTAIGSTVNLAARLQSLTRTLDAAVVIDATTWRALDGTRADFEERAQVPIRGFDVPRDLYVLPLEAAA
jgi:class 3 adenylate cyclase